MKRHGSLFLMMCLLVAVMFIVNICQPVISSSVEDVEIDDLNAQASSVSNTLTAEASSSVVWEPGMYWEFNLIEGGVHTDDVTMTVLNAEPFSSTHLAERMTYKVKEEHTAAPEGTFYSWWDASTLDLVARYSSAVYKDLENFGNVQGYLNQSWTYDGTPMPYKVGDEFSMAYLRWNYISAMGWTVERDYPGIFKVEGMEEVTVPAGTFNCYNITITSTSADSYGSINWNFYYNDTVKHWVKMYDHRYPSMSTTFAIYELTSYGAQTGPVFTIESGEVNTKDYIISWSAQDYATEYVLYENEVEIYRGTETSFEVTSRADGTYVYEVEAVDSGGSVSPSEKGVTIEVVYEVPIPKINNENGNVSSGELVITWTSVEGADSYRLFLGDEEIYSGTETSFKVTDLSNGVHRFRVTALDGDLESAMSTSLLITVALEDVGDKEEGSDGDGTTPILVFALVVGALVIVGIAFLLMKRKR